MALDLSSLGSDIVAGATALGGLQLVFLGSVVSDFASFETTQQASIIRTHRPRAWQAVAGVIGSLGAAILALYGKWFEVPGLTYSSVVVLTVVIFATCFSAVKTAMDIN